MPERVKIRCAVYCIIRGARRDGKAATAKAPDDIAFFATYGAERPYVGTFAVIDYGARDGFGLLVDIGEATGRGLTIEQEASHIAGGPEKATAERWIVETRGGAGNADTRTVSECDSETEARTLAARLAGAKLYREATYADGKRRAVPVDPSLPSALGRAPI